MCFGHFFCLSKGILVIYQTYRGILFLFKSSRVFWLVLDIRGAPVIFDALGVLRSFFNVLGVF